MHVVCPICSRHYELNKDQLSHGVSTRHTKCKACGTIFKIGNLQANLKENRQQSDLLSTTPFVESVTGMEFVLIPAGEFFMGDDDGERRPKHKVIITQPYHFAKFPVTQSQWEAIMGYNPSHFKGQNNPVENVSWYDAVNFVEKLNSGGGKSFRLPTEAEWEYACRAGNSAKFFFGDDPSKLSEYAWYYIAGEENSYHQATHEVGLKKPNPWGIYDMLGNVREWCWDRYGRDSYKSHQMENPLDLLSNETRPLTGSGLPCRVLRGGCYNNPHSLISCSSRNYYEPDFRYSNIGFRIVCQDSQDLSLWKESLKKESTFTPDCIDFDTEEITSPTEGFLYILINPSLQKNFLKIGMTSRDPEQRAKELSSHTGVPAPYYVAYSAKVRDFRLAEREVHHTLKNFRARGDREFFYLPLEKAIQIISEIVADK